MSWRIRGTYFESCNCDAICPCRRIDGVAGGRSTHGVCMGVLSWLIPGIEPTGRQASVAAIAVVDFDRGAIAAQRTLWDGASLAAQLGVTVGPPQAAPRG